MKKDWIKVQDAADRLGMTRSGIYKHLEVGSFPRKELKDYPVKMINWNYLKEKYKVK